MELVIGSDSQQQVTVVSCNEGTFTPEIGKYKYLQTYSKTILFKIFIFFKMKKNINTTNKIKDLFYGHNYV